MKRSLATAILAAVAAVLVLGAGCSKSPLAKAADYTKQAVSILEANKDNPEKAASELEKYAADNEADLKAVAAEMEKFKAEVEKDPSKVADAMEHMGPMLEAAGKMMELMNSNPELMKNEKVQAALGKLSFK